MYKTLYGKLYDELNHPNTPLTSSEKSECSWPRFATTSRRDWPQIYYFFNDYFYLENLRHQSIPSEGNDDRRNFKPNYVSNSMFEVV